MRRATWILLLLGVALWSVRMVPTLGFCDPDALGLIAANRLEAPADPVRLLVQEVGGEQRPGIRFHRPLCGLSYGLGHALHGLKPRGFHRVDVLLHAGVALLLAWVLRGAGIAAWAAVAGGLGMAAHPVSMEVVPAIARRGDLLATAFLLVAAGSTLRAGSGPRWWILALVAAGLAPLAKETGYLAPVVVAAAAGPRWRRQGALALAAIGPAIALRLAALGGVGGYPGAGPRPDALWGAGLRVLDRAEVLGYAGTNLLALAALALVGGLVWRHPARVGWAVALVTGHLVLAVASGPVAPWYLYAPTVGWIALLASAAAIPRILPRTVAAGFAAVALLGSPAWTDYPEWRVASDLSTRWIDETVRTATPSDGPLVLAGIPSSIRVEDRRRWAARSPRILRDLSLDAALDLRDDATRVEGVAVVHLRSLDPEYRVVADPVPGGWLLRVEGAVDLRPPVGVDWVQQDGWWVGPTGWRVRRAGNGLVLQPGTGQLWIWDGDRLRPAPPAGPPPR